MSHEDRICIVGAGAAGLAAARYLRDRGHRHVTVFEADDRVGGKCCTVSHQGQRFDLGAVLVTAGCANVLALARRYGVGARPSPRHVLLDLERGTRRRFGSTAGRFRDRQTRRAVGRLLRLMVAHRRLAQPGFGALEPDLHLPVAEYFERHGLTPLAELYYPMLTGYGYGYATQIPMAYLLKMLYLIVPRDPATLARWVLWTSGLSGSFMLEGGYQSLWEKVARDGLDVRLGAPVERVVRDHGRVRVTVAGERHDFDRLIVAVDPRAAERFLDLSPTETRLLSQVRYVGYHTVLCEADQMPPNTALFFANHFSPASQGRLVLAVQVGKTAPACLAYVVDRTAVPSRELFANIASDMTRMGARFRRVVEHRRWRYFPYVEPARMRSFFAEMTRNQGERRTYFAGETMNFPTVETVCQYSRHLVERFF